MANQFTRMLWNGNKELLISEAQDRRADIRTMIARIATMDPARAAELYTNPEISRLLSAREQRQGEVSPLKHHRKQGRNRIVSTLGRPKVLPKLQKDCADLEAVFGYVSQQLTLVEGNPFIRGYESHALFLPDNAR